jgi:integrase/recombinase XerD
LATSAKAHSHRVSFLKYLAHAHKALNFSNNIELSPHALRKCFATNNTTTGMPLNILQQFLGHEKIPTTSIYIKKAGLSVLSEYKPID